MSEDNANVLKLDGEITRDQYKECIERMVEYLNGDLKTEMEWCSQRHRYFDALIIEYESDGRDGALEVNLIPGEADFAQRLRDIRARLLWYAKNETITVWTANKILARSGLQEYNNNGKPVGRRISVSLPTITLNIGGDEMSCLEWIEQNILSMILDGLDGKIFEAKGDDKQNRYVPGSAAFENHPHRYVDAEEVTQEVSIPESETLRPSYC